MTVKTILGKYGLSTFAPDANLTDEEAEKVEECAEYIRSRLRKSYLMNTRQTNDGQYSLSEDDIELRR